MSSQARSELRPYVRAYAQRVVEKDDAVVIQSVPAMLEQILNLELGVMPGILHQGRKLSDVTLIGGVQSSFSGYIELGPGVESFAVFFQPAGWSLLFNLPVAELANRFFDVTTIGGSALRSLWNRMGEVSNFESRVQIIEEFLLRRVACACANTRMTSAVNYIFLRHGAVIISSLAYEYSLGLRQFERTFERETGVLPKHFARIARFQAALDAKLASSQRTWLDIAHSFGYYDQMHMIHDFEKLGRAIPTKLIAQMGDVRPPALVSKKNK